MVYQTNIPTGLYKTSRHYCSGKAWLCSINHFIEFIPEPSVKTTPALLLPGRINVGGSIELTKGESLIIIDEQIIAETATGADRVLFATNESSEYFAGEYQAAIGLRPCGRSPIAITPTGPDCSFAQQMPAGVAHLHRINPGNDWRNLYCL